MDELEENRRRLIHYVAKVRTALRLDNWDVVLAADYLDDGEGAHAETWQNKNHFVLNIRLCEGFFDLEPAGIRNTVVHELVHTLHRDANWAWDQAMDHLPKVLAESLEGVYQMNMERFVAWTADRVELQVPEYNPKAKVSDELPPGCFINPRPS